jgi:hypothetical protein
MSRKLRIEYPGAMYHAMNRGDQREDIFKDDVKGSVNEIDSAEEPVHGELPFRQQLAVQTIRGNGFPNGNSEGWLAEVLSRPLSPRACRRIALGVPAPRCRTF